MSKPVQMVRFKADKQVFEVMTNVGFCQKYRDGKASLDDTVMGDMIFTNQSKGETANTTQLEAAFGTSNVMDCIKKVLEKGEIQLTTAQRKEIQEKKKREIVEYVHKYYIDPRSKKPHPSTRIEAAMDTLKFNVDWEQPVDRQIATLVKKLPDVLPVKKCEMNGVLSIPHQHLGSVSGALQKYCQTRSEKYDGKGCTMEVSVVPGDFDALMKELNRICKGDFQFDIEGQDAMSASSNDTAAEKGGKGKKGGKKGKGRR